MSSLEKNYTLKFLILFLATGAAIFAIWYALVREESVDWLSSQIAHQVSPYAVTETEDGLIITNVLIGYSFDLPKGFKTTGAKNLSFFRGEAEAKECEIKHYSSANKSGGPAADRTKLIIPLGQKKLIFELVNKSEISDCWKYLFGIGNNLVTN